MTAGNPGGDGGLQAERTHLAWTRTSLAVLANGVLILLKDPFAHGGGQPARLTVAVLAAATAAGIYLTGVRRQRMLAARPLPQQLTARMTIIGVGVAMLTLTSVVLAYLIAPLA